MPTALVLGGAQCVWDDAYAACSLFKPDAVFAVNDMMGLWPLRVDYGITLHPDKVGAFLRGRRGNFDFDIWSHKPHKNVHRATGDWAGSSSLFAVKVAMQEGFDAIVLAGVPMVIEQGHVVRKTKWTSAEMFRKGWLKHLAEIKPVTRSMSGWTMEFLGLPTMEWLSERNAATSDHEVVSKLKEKADGFVKNCS